jgi:hypothetical protein
LEGWKIVIFGFEPPSSIHCFCNAALRISAGWSAWRPVPCLICWRQLTPAAAMIKPGTEVTLVWGEDGGGKRSAPWIEPHVQMNIRAIVAPSPISHAAQEYRTVLNAVRNAA